MRRTRAKVEARNRQHDSALSISENEMTGLGLFASSSSSPSSSSNLSPLALPFTVNPGKFNFGSSLDSHFNFQTSTTTQGLLADSIRTATVPTTYSTHNRSSIPAVNSSVIGPNQRVTDASFSSPFNTHNWSSMNSSVKSGLEHVNPPATYMFGLNPNTQPHKWSLGHDDDDFNLFYGSSQGGYSQTLSGSKYSGQADGSRGKEDSSLFGNSIIGKSHGTSSPATCHGVVSSGFSNEHTVTWSGCTSHFPFETRSIFYDSSSDHLSPSMTTKSLDTSSTSLFNKNNVSVTRNPLKEKESYQSLGFEYKSSLNPQVSDINSTEDVNSATHLSEHLDHHNPGEDSPCWKGAPTHFSSSGSQEMESLQHAMKKLQTNSGDDVLLHMDQSLHQTVGNAASVVTSESLDVNMVVKALNNLSELLLRQYSKVECGLKEQDHKALDHVISNLNVCMSRKIQQVDPAQRCSSPQQITSNVLRKERNNDQFGKNIEEQSAYVRDVGLPEDNMVQKIKRVLDENLEFKEDLPSDPLLYKNLWLEAEAELCISSYRTRLHRAKREMGKSKALDLSEVASEIKKISSSNYSPTAPEPLHDAAGSKTSTTREPNLSLPIVYEFDDVEDSVLARFNILKCREESNPVNMAEKEPADVKASGNKIQSSGVAEEPHLQHLLDTDDAVMVHYHCNQKMQVPLGIEHVDHAVMARLNILKSRGELEHVKAEQRVLADGARGQVSEEGMGRSMMQNQFGSSTACSASSFGWEYVLEG
ncbi:hypothetical protein L1987_12824 [Smallanthus sonchifolius]|uniref:Uncharacterized protein n=1 Tax=Smallanthus sonchifolius TaxID=185202 RepID=A0ACB9JFU1_9ASTR|nr:hypothetical protein L1987_12824 [Smallanthus sonchifolius]